MSSPISLSLWLRGTWLPMCPSARPRRTLSFGTIVALFILSLHLSPSWVDRLVFPVTCHLLLLLLYCWCNEPVDTAATSYKEQMPQIRSWGKHELTSSFLESKPLMWDHMEGVPNIYMNLQPGLRGWLVNHFLSPMEWFGLLDRFREMLSRTWWVSTQPHRYSEKRHAAVGGTCSRCWHGWCITNPTTNTNIIQLVILTQARTPKDFKGKGKRNPTWFSVERAAESSRKHQCWE